MNFNISLKPSPAQSLKITWKIPEYFSLPETEDVILDSPSFNFMNATWCLRIYPNNPRGTFVSVVRLHSLVADNEIICNFGLVLGNGDCYNVDDCYLKFVCDEDDYEKNRVCPGLPERSTLAADQKKFTLNGTLVIMCHFLSEETPEDNKVVRTCKPNNIIYEGTDVQKDPSNLSLKPSKAQSLKIIWTIPEFEYFSLPDTSGYALSSSSFNFGYTTWFLKWYPNGNKDSLDTIVSVSRLQSLALPQQKIIYAFGIRAKKKESYHHSYDKYVFSENNELEEHFPKKSVLLEVSRHNASDYVTFSSHFFFEESAENDEIVRNMLYELHGYRTLCKDFKSLFLNGKDHDLILKVKEKDFRVHRNILSVRSQVFESMLTHNMTEKNSGVVDIPDCDPLAMEQLLLYVYSGKVDSLNDSNMLGLYYAADKYSMMHLKEECRDFIRNSLSPRNICNVVQLASNHCDETLLQYATEYFVNNTTEILTTAEWMSFLKENETVANGLFIKASRKLTDENKMLKMEKLPP